MGDWRDIVQGIPADVDVVEANTTATVTVGGIVLRFQRRIDNGWELDEIVGYCHLHLEQMSGEFYWLGITTGAVHLNIDIGSASGRAEVTAGGWFD